MAFQDVAFLFSRATFYTTFPSTCGRGESLGTTTCPKNVVGGKQVHYAPCKILSLRQSLFVSVKFHGDHKIVIKLRLIWPPSVVGKLPDLRHWCQSVICKLS